VQSNKIWRLSPGPLHVAGSSSLRRAVEDGRSVSEMYVRSTPASGIGAGRPHDTAFSAFVFTSPLTIQLLVHLGISALAAASDLTFKIVLYVLLKLAVVPGLCTVVDAQELDESVLIRFAHYHRKPLPKRKPLQPSLTRSKGPSKVRRLLSDHDLVRL
jgi:hypothetical protein